MKTPRQKYNNDPSYAALVDTLCAHIHKAQFTPSELREASILACILYHEQTVQIELPPNIQHALNILNAWTNNENR